MAVCILLFLALNILGQSLGEQRNETKLLSNSTTQLKSVHTTSSTLLQSTTSQPPMDTPTSPVYSSTPIKLITKSIPRTENKITTTAPQSTTSNVPQTTTTTINSSVEVTATEGKNSSKLTNHRENTATSPLPVLHRISSTNPTPSRIPTVPQTIHYVTTEAFPKLNHIDDTRQVTSKTEYANVEETTTENIRGYTSTAEVDPSDEGWSTTTETASDWEMENSTPEESSTVEDNTMETEEPATENSDQSDITYSTTDLPDHMITTDSSFESNSEDSSAELSPISAKRDYTKAENHASPRDSSCPPGRAGLACRRAEARRTADECSGGNCEKCRSCNNTAATDWPHCCRKNFRCCSELALACQQCDQPTLQEFCTMHFKRCF